jgi:hypothetical protein
MSANEKQVGGKHYKTKYEHWDLVIKLDLGYLQGCTTKYVSRSRKKGGVEDLLKAQHYLDKLIEVANKHVRYSHHRSNITNRYVHVEVSRFAFENQLTDLEEEYIYVLCCYLTMLDLEHARALLAEIIEEAKFNEKDSKREEPNRPGTPEDGGHHERFLSDE